MVQIVVGPDIEQLLIDGLPGRLAEYEVVGIPVGTKPQVTITVLR